MDKQTFGPIDIFRTGTFSPMQGGSLSFSQSDLQNIADTYNFGDASAPVVLGHPRTDAPAYGWVEKLIVDGDKLKATISNATAEFVGMVKDGRYKKVSASFFKPDAPNNPKPGAWHLKHLGFLGAAAPAVTGLKPVAFAGLSTGDSYEFAFETEELSFSEMQRELVELRREKSEREVEKLVADGKLLPVFKDEVLEFVGCLDTSETFEFSEGHEQTPREWFLKFLSKQPQIVSFGEVDMGSDPYTEGENSLAIPTGYTVDPVQQELYNRARDIQRQKEISFAEAVDIAASK